MSTTTSDSFVDLLEKSQLLSTGRIEEIRASANGSSSPKTIAHRLVKEKQLTRWQAAMLLRGRHALRLGKYRLLEPLSSGDLGDVFLAEHEQMGRRVAIRILSRDITDNSERVERFLADSQEVAKLDHRNIIHVYDIAKEGDRYFIVMEYSDGANLDVKLEDDGRVSRENAAEYVRQALDALAYAHEHNMLHLGLRPNSISVDDKGTVKVRNFGMASLAEAFASSDDEHAVEKNRYAAPEQRDGSEVDQRTDICSLGIIGFQLLTGQLPTASAKRTNSTLEKIFRKMMAKRPEDRFQTAADASAYLEKWLTKYRLQKCFSVSSAEEESEAPAKPLPKAKSLSDSKDGLAIARKGSEEPSDSDGEVSLFGDDLSALEQQGDAVGGAPIINTDFAVKAPAKDAKPSPPSRKKDDSDDLATVEPESKKSRTGLFIGIGAGVAALIIIGLVVALIVVINSKDEPEIVAKTQPKSPAAADKSDDSPKNDETGQPTNETGGKANGETSDNEVVDAKGGVKTDNTGTTTQEVTPDKVGVTDTPPVGVENPATPPENNNGGGDTKPANSEPATPEVKPMPEPMPKPKDPPKPKAPPKPANPFAGLTNTFDLPALGTSQKPEEGSLEPVEIGAVKMDEFDFLDVGLIGGEGAYRGKKIVIKPGDGGLSQRKFEIYVSPSSVADGGELMVAKIWIDDKQKLLFQWTKEAEAEVASHSLRNCKVELRSGAVIHDLTFRKPVEMEPLLLDLEKGGAQSEAVVEWMPNAAQVRMEVAGLSGNAPPHRFDDATGQILDLGARGGNTRLFIGTANQELLFLKISAAVKGRDRVEVTVLPQVTLGPKPTTFSRKKIDPVLAQLKAKQQFHLTRKTALEKQDKNKFKQQIEVEDGQANLAGQQAAAVEGLIKAVEQLNGSQIAVRLYYETEDGYQILLAKAGEVNSPKQPEKK